MTTADAKKEQYRDALATLQEAYEAALKESGKMKLFLRDACIQRFEYSFDLAWKLLKERLFKEHGVDCTSPKTCLKAAFAEKLIDESELWAKMADWRNLTSHVYYEKIADEVFARLDEIIKAMEKLSNDVSK